MIHDVEHLFTWLLAISKSSLEKCLFTSSVGFLIRFFFFFFGSGCMNSLCTLNINLLSDISFPIQQANFVFC